MTKLSYGVDLEPDEDGFIRFVIKTKHGIEKYLPQELTGFMLSYLIKNAEHLLGKISDVVITTPAFYQSTRRNIIKTTGLYIDIVDNLYDNCP